jgi:3'(2'), 5'-bisphosphate nucleotidase
VEIDLQSLLDPVIAIAEDAGQRIMSIFKQEYSIEYKEDNTPVTRADFMAHDAILAGLNIITPELPLISEEDPVPGYATRADWEYFWIVDPLDGTREFINHRDGFSVNIALVHRDRPVLGVIHAPVSGTSFYASAGSGAFRRDGQHRLGTRMHCRKKHRSPPMIAVSRTRQGGRLAEYLKRIGEYEIFPIGSSLKSCLVAEGIADLYPCLGPTSEWDTAAAQCIVEEAGGHMTDFSNAPLRYNRRESMVNPAFLVYGDPQARWSEYRE